MNNYIKHIIATRLDSISNKDNFIKECHNLNQCGVTSDNDLNDYFELNYRLAHILANVFKIKLDIPTKTKIAYNLFTNRKDIQINNLFALSAAIEEQLNKFSIKKTAYPQGFNDPYYDHPYNLNKWKKAAYAIGFHMNQGVSELDAIDLLTKKWDKMERNDFKTWIKYYQDGEDKKYPQVKVAQNRFVEIGNGGFLPVNQLKAKLPSYNDFDSLDIEDQVQNIQRLTQEEEIQKQIKALIGRLNSAERLATTRGIEKALGTGYSKWLEALHSLKREIQISMLKSKRASLIPDMIIRKGNQLIAQGHHAPGMLMIKMAQVAPPAVAPKPEGPSPEAVEGKELNDAENENIPSADLQPDVPVGEGGAEEGLGLNAEMGAFNDEEEDESTWVDEFLEGLNGDTISEDEEEALQDDNESDDLLTISEDEIYDLQKTAQLAVENAPVNNTPPVGEVGSKPLGTGGGGSGRDGSGGVGGGGGIGPGKDGPAPFVRSVAPPNVLPSKSPTSPLAQAPGATDNNLNIKKLEDALNSITVSDVVDLLEKLQSIFQTREISHQLGLADSALQNLGLSPFFPDLGEATAKSLDANQYCLTRVTDVLSRLRGSDIAPASPIESFDLEGKKHVVTDPAAKGIANSLEAEEAKEAERAKAREKAKADKEDAMIQSLNNPTPAEPTAPAPPNPLTPSPAQEIAQEPAKITQTGPAKV